MKVIHKVDALKRRQEGHVRAERDLLIEASELCKWIVKLIYSFQDEENLYIIMEYMAGGDLLTLLIRRDTLPENVTRFYAAQMVLAIDEAHQLGYVHRDIKPDNFLFNEIGHLRLSDFGLATDFHWVHDAAFYELHRSRTHSGFSGSRPQSAYGMEDSKTSQKPDEKRNSLGPDFYLNPPTDEKVLDWREKNRKKMAYSVVGTNK
jgi:serine/threonine-protein kinase LATS1/2